MNKAWKAMWETPKNPENYSPMSTWSTELKEQTIVGGRCRYGRFIKSIPGSPDTAQHDTTARKSVGKPLKAN